MIRILSLVLLLVFVVQLSLCFAQTSEYPAPPPPRPDVQPPIEVEPGPVVKNDRLEPDRAPVFDPTLVSDRTLAFRDLNSPWDWKENPAGPPEVEWEVNDSAASFWLDSKESPLDGSGKFSRIYPSYADLLAEHPSCLPSINMIDGKAKQFDDGLYAALDLAHYRGLKKVLASHVELIERIGANTDNRAALSYLSAGLSYAGRKPLPGAEAVLILKFKTDFERSQIAAKPMGFYTWTDELTSLFCFMRFFMITVPEPDPQWELEGMCASLCLAIVSDDELQADYEASVAFYEKLTNPRLGQCLENFYRIRSPEKLTEMVDCGIDPQSCPPLWPASRSRETIFFSVGLSIPRSTDLEGAPRMARFISAIKNGSVDLKPGEGEGWYQYQSYALQSFLLPCQGLASQKLLFSKRYKNRIEEAFAALLTKRRETHARQMAGRGYAPLMPVAPRIRLEPNPLFYLRTARAYSFLQGVLYDRIGKRKLATLHGLRDGGLREPDLDDELEWMRKFFYGCYLTCCQDLGLRPDLAPGELDPAAREKASDIALQWLADFKNDPDLAVDTRVAVPMDLEEEDSLWIWATAGVRCARLNVSYSGGRHPQIRRKGGDDESWQPVEDVLAKHYIIPVDLFVEAPNPNGWLPDRAELRAICDEAETEEDIIEILSRHE